MSVTDFLVDSLLSNPPPKVSLDQATELVHRHYGLVVEAQSLGGERDANFRVSTAQGTSFVLKFANPDESAQVTNLSSAAFEHIALRDPEIPLQRIVPALEGDVDIRVKVGEGVNVVMRLFTWLEGVPLYTVARCQAQRTEIARLAARMDLALADFSHPATENHVLLWDLKQFAHLRSLITTIDDAGQRARLNAVFDRYDAVVAPHLATLRSQLIHNDLNPHNLLVFPEAPSTVSGILDLGDAVHTALIHEVAVACSYQLEREAVDPLQNIVEFISAYHRVLPLQPLELELLLDLIRARLATTVLITSWRAQRYPENRAYIVRNAASAWAGLECLEGISVETATDCFMAACGHAYLPHKESDMHDHVMPNAYRPGGAELSDEDQHLIERRERLLGPAYRLFYQNPLHVVRGEGVWLYDNADNAYLDVYNNVASVGHCHPRVVAAIAKQSATLSTHTRYLSESILDFAESLLATFPDELSQLMLTCTGSEANDLALRTACSYTGGTGVIVTECAYHGVTKAIAEISPSMGIGVASHVRTVPAPNSYRNAGEDVGAQLRKHVEEALADMKRHGIKPAAFICDGIFSSDGVFTEPAGFLTGAVEAVRAEGALYIADEVQSGFGRTGTNMWGFQRHGLIPDIVTMGKPMGNGYPVAGVVFRPQVLKEFGAKVRYFNTFGGNTVAVAAAHAVLRVIQEEKLMDNSRVVGDYLANGLRSLMADHPVIGDVRHAGLFVGVEIVDADKQPDAALTATLVNKLRERRVLISATGPDANILKIRPPLVFNHDNADFFLDQLQAVIAAASH